MWHNMIWYDIISYNRMWYNNLSCHIIWHTILYYNIRPPDGLHVNGCATGGRRSGRPPDDMGDVRRGAWVVKRTTMAGGEILARGRVGLHHGSPKRRGCTTRVHWRLRCMHGSTGGCTGSWGRCAAPLARSCHLSRTRSSLRQNGRSVCVWGGEQSEQTVALQSFSGAAIQPLIWCFESISTQESCFFGGTLCLFHTYLWCPHASSPNYSIV